MLKETSILIKGMTAGVFTAFFALVAPIKPMMFLVGAFIIVNALFSLCKNKKNPSKVKAKAFLKIMFKIFVYEFALVSFFLIDFYMLNDLSKIFSPVDLFFTKILDAILCGIEFFMFLDNVKKYFGYDLIAEGKKALVRSKNIKDTVVDFNKNDDNETPN